MWDRCYIFSSSLLKYKFLRLAKSLLKKCIYYLNIVHGLTHIVAVQSFGTMIDSLRQIYLGGSFNLVLILVLGFGCSQNSYENSNTLYCPPMLTLGLKFEIESQFLLMRQFYFQVL